MSLEDDLRTALRDRAAESAPLPDLLDRVDAGVRRDNRRRVALACGAAGLTLVTVVAAPALLRGRPEHPRPTAAAVPVVAGTPRPAGWTEPGWAQPAFPLTPGWLPAAVGPPRVLRMGPNALLEYGRPGSVLSAEIGTVPGSWEAEATEEHTATVGGRRATVRTSGNYDGSGPGDRYVGIRWRLADGRWMQVLSFGPRTEADVLRFARALRPGSIAAGPAPFTITAVPPGLTLQHQSEAMMCLASPGMTRRQTPQGQRTPHGLCLYVDREPFEPETATEIVTVAGRRAAYRPGSAGLDVDLGGGRVLSLDWDPEEISITREDVIRFAAGVRVMTG